MLLELMLNDERREGRAEGMMPVKESIIDFLSDIGPVPEHLQKTIMNETNIDTLKSWIKLAARSSSIEEFSENM